MFSTGYYAGFNDVGEIGYWLTSTENGSKAGSVEIDFDYHLVSIGTNAAKTNRVSVRCLKD